MHSAGLAAVLWLVGLGATTTLIGGCNPRAFDRLGSRSSADAGMSRDAEAPGTAVGRDAAGPGAGGGLPDAAAAQLDASVDGADDAAERAGPDAAAMDAATDAAVEASDAAADSEPPDVGPETGEDGADAEPSEAGPAQACRHLGAAPIEVAGAEELGALPLPEGAQNHLFSYSMRYGERIRWMLNMNMDDGPSRVTLAYAEPDTPLVLSHVMDEQGLPLDILPRAAMEASLYDSLRVDAVVLLRERTLFVVTHFFGVNPMQVFVAELRGEGPSLTRLGGTLFEPSTEDPWFATAGVADRQYLYLYDERRGGVARAPLAVVGTRARYEMFSADSSSWTSDLSLAQQRAFETQAGQVRSVQPNAYLGGYLAAYSAPAAESLTLAVAAAPEGPFEPIAEVELEPSAVSGFTNDGVVQQLGMQGDCDRVLYFTYRRPLESRYFDTPELQGTFPTRYETRVVRVELH